MRTSPTSFKVHQLITQFQGGTLIPRPEFQRRHVWSRKDKVAFIETIIKGFPFPEIYLADGSVDLKTGKGTQLLVDGQQRVTAIIEYFRGEIKYINRLGLSPYTSLSEDQQKAFMQYDVAVRNLGTVEPDVLVDVFRRINLTSYSLTEMEINNAVYSGEFKQFAQTVADYEFFERKGFFRPQQIRRMGDVSYVATLTATMMSDYFNRDDDLEEYLRMFNDDFPRAAEMRDRIDAVLAFIETLEMPKASRMWKQSDFFTLLIELDRSLVAGEPPLNPASVAEQLGQFYGAVDLPDNEKPEWAAAYHKAAIQAANDRSNRSTRGAFIAEVIRQSV